MNESERQYKDGELNGTLQMALEFLSRAQNTGIHVPLLSGRERDEAQKKKLEQVGEHLRCARGQLDAAQHLLELLEA